MSTYATSPGLSTAKAAAEVINQHIEGISTALTASELRNLFDTFKNNGPYVVTDTAFSTSSNFPLNVTTPDTVIIADTSATTSSDIDTALGPNDSGQVPNKDSTIVNNTSGAPVEIVTPDNSSSSVSLILQNGAATVTGGGAHNFLVDASADSSGVNITASSAEGSFSSLIGGSGSDTLTGSSGANSTSVLTAGDGPTTMIGGLGAVTMTAGSGGSNFLDATSSVSAKLDDTLGDGSDSIIAGGNDTIFGSQYGSSITLTGGSDTIDLGKGTAFTDTITAGTAPSSINFAGYNATQVQGLVDAAKLNADGSKTIDFSKIGGSGQVVLDNYNSTHITFK